MHSWNSPSATALRRRTRRSRRRAAASVPERQTDCDRKSAADDRVAAVEAPADVEEVHRAAPPSAAAFDAAEHLGHDRPSGDPAGQRVTVLAVGRDDVVLGLQGSASRRPRPLPHRCRGAGSRGSAPRCTARRNAPRTGGCAASRGRARSGSASRASTVIASCSSSVERSPSGSPSSRARSTRRTIFPLRVFGRCSANAISFGATAAPRRFRAEADELEAQRRRRARSPPST